MKDASNKDFHGKCFCPKEIRKSACLWREDCNLLKQEGTDKQD